jgi:hypothetical protein
MSEKEFDFNHWNKGLDDLFREAADAEQPVAPPHAWLKMNQLLDEDDRKRRRRFGWWWLPLFLFLAGHQHFLPENSFGTATSPTQAMPEKNTAVGIENSISEIALNKPNQQEQTETPEQTLHTSKTTKTSTTNQNKKPLNDNNQNLVPIPQPKYELTTNSRTKFNYSTPGINTNPEDALLQPDPYDSESNSIHEKSLYPSMPKRNRISLPVTLTVPDPALPDQKITDSSKSEQETNFRFYVYAGAGADRGFINRKHASDYKPAYGGGIGMQLNKRWAIQAGIFQTRKIYEAPGDAYTPKKGSYYDNPNYKIKEVYADCAILEIPVSVRYSFLQNKKQQFFGMLSAQTAIMQRESYDYYYTRFGQPAKGYYTYRTNALELFSGIGFSVGYERKINNHLHWQIAPYFNLPTSGIGEGAVKLRSAGIFTGFRYSFWKKK